MREGDQVVYQGSVLDHEEFPEYLGQQGRVEQVDPTGEWVVVMMPDGERIDGMAMEFYSTEVEQ